MASYTIAHVPNTPYAAVVLATSFLNPFDDLSAIATDLAGCPGTVLFDLLLAVGQSSHRYLCRLMGHTLRCRPLHRLLGWRPR